MSAKVETVEAGYQLELLLRDGDDSIRRMLVGSDCEQVSDAVALLVAVMLDPVASAREVQLRTRRLHPRRSGRQRGRVWRTVAGRARRRVDTEARALARGGRLP